MMKKVISTFLCLMVLGAVQSLPAKIYIYIDAPATSKFPIAIEPFKNIGGAAGINDVAATLSSVISGDLEISGLFRLIDPKTFIASPEDREIAADRIKWDDWSLLGAEALARGGVYQEEKGLRVEARLYDVVKSSFISGKRYFGEPADARLMAHKFADEIIYQLTGEKGIFQTRIAFISDRTGRKEAYLIDFDGKNQTQVTSHRSIVLSPAWSPDGKKLLYTSYKMGNPDVYMKDLFQGQETRLSHYRGINLAADWSPDGGKIVLTLSEDNGNSDIYLINPQGEKLKRLTKEWANDVSPCWSPDGREIAFVSNRAGNPQIYIMDVQSEKVRRLTFSGSYNTSPAWSPRGDQIAYASMTGSTFSICTISTAGGIPRQLTDAGSCESPAWSPDGRHLAFSSNRSGKKKIFIMLADGSGIRPVTGGQGNDTNPSWSPYIDYR
jgi:TolB protein